MYTLSPIPLGNYKTNLKIWEIKNQSLWFNWYEPTDYVRVQFDILWRFIFGSNNTTYY